MVVVPDNKLSLAIGRRGQNVRLAAHLTGFRIDIKSATEFEEMEAANELGGFAQEAEEILADAAILETEVSAAEATDFDAAAEETVLETAGLESEAEELD